MTRAYYNENDEFAVDWLRNLIKAGLIADGEVDTRSIVDVRPGDLAGFTQCHFFAGIGGWSYALRAAGWDDSRPAWTGSCPCQPFSLAGAQRGFADERHLWPVWRDLIRECGPSVVFGEQVASATEWLGLVRGDLEALGYAVGALPIQAASAGADHLRDRYWFVADADHAGSQGRGLLPERASERTAGPDGVAYADCIGSDQINPDARGRSNGSGAKQGAGLGGARHGGGLADADKLGASAERQQRSREQCGPGCDPGPCSLGDGERGRRETGPRSAEVGRSTAVEGIAGHPSARTSSGASGALDWVVGADGKARRVKPGIRLLAHGFPNRVGLLRGFGNAIDHRPAKEFIKAYMTTRSVSSQQGNAP